MKVTWIRNPWYDDHWDLPKDSMKAGKTFVMLNQGRHDTLGYSYSLIGWGLYEKFDRGLELLKRVADDGKTKLAQKAVSYSVYTIGSSNTYIMM